MNQRLRKLGASCLVLALAMGLCAPYAAAGSENEAAVRHRIAIVLDNSDSMIVDPRGVDYLTRWSEATHALRTFLYMVKSTDEVKLFTVSRADSNDASEEEHKTAATVSDENLTKDNVDRQLEKVGISYDTRVYGIDAAYDWARRGGPDMEKWVVILSDGAFYNEQGLMSYEDSVGKRAENANKNNIHTIFVGLEVNDGELRNLRNNYDLSVFNTVGGAQGGIEETILGISEKIYGMKKLELDKNALAASEEFTYDNETGTLTWATEPGLSAYLKQVIIIAQTETTAETGPTPPADADMQIIRSDSRFSWCGERELATVLSEHDKRAYPKFRIGDPAAFLNKIEETFLNKYCYIRSYGEDEIGESVAFHAPRGDYSYRVYYELKDSVRPTLQIIQNGGEAKPDQAGILPVMEGPFRIDYRLVSEGVSIPQTLDAIRQETGKIRIDGAVAEDPGAELPGFSYNGDEPGRHTVEVSFDTMKETALLEVVPDIRPGSLTISRGQKLNLDRPEENYLELRTTIPYAWLKDNLKQELSVEAGEALAFDVDAFEVERAGDVCRIRIPVDIAGIEMALGQKVSVSAAFIVRGSDSNRLETTGSVTVEQEAPRIAMEPPDKELNLAKLFREKDALRMTAYVMGKDVTGETTLANVTVTGIDGLEDMPFRYNEATKRVEYTGNLLKSFRILRDGKNEETVRIKGEVYRNGVRFDESGEWEATIRWSGMLRGLMGQILKAAATMGIFLAVILATKKGWLMFRERIGRCWPFDNVKDGTFPLRWRIDGDWMEVTTNGGLRWYPWMLSLAFHMEDRFIDSRERIHLVGTKTGYRLTLRSGERLPDGIVFVSDSSELNSINDELVFRANTGKETKEYRLVYANSRHHFLTRVITFVICVVLAALILPRF